MIRSIDEAMTKASTDEIVRLLRDFEPQLGEEASSLEWEATKRRVTNAGPIDPEDVQAVLDILAATKDITTDLTPEQLFTNRFIYGY